MEVNMDTTYDLDRYMYNSNFLLYWQKSREWRHLVHFVSLWENGEHAAADHNTLVHKPKTFW